MEVTDSAALSDAEDDILGAGCRPEASLALGGPTAEAPVLSDGDMPISPRPSKRPRTEPRSLKVSPDHMVPEAKRSRLNTALANRRSRSPRAKSSSRDMHSHDRSQSRCQNCSIFSQDSIKSRSRSRDRSQGKSPSQNGRSCSRTRNHNQDGCRSHAAPRDWRDIRDSTPPYLQRRPPEKYGVDDPVTSSGDARRKASISEEERKRGQRLFGGLFGAAAHTTSRPRTGLRPGGSVDVRGPNGSDRRLRGATIDRRSDYPRQTEKEREENREQPASLDRIREIEQIKMDEQKMYALHAKELVLAQSLHTRSKPMLHYRPRKLTKAQEREIEDQVRSSSKRRIKKEIESFEKEKQTRLSALGLQSISAINVSKPSRSTTTFVRS